MSLLSPHPPPPSKLSTDWLDIDSRPRPCCSACRSFRWLRVNRRYDSTTLVFNLAHALHLSTIILSCSTRFPRSDTSDYFGPRRHQSRHGPKQSLTRPAPHPRHVLSALPPRPPPSHSLPLPRLPRDATPPAPCVARLGLVLDRRVLRLVRDHGRLWTGALLSRSRRPTISGQLCAYAFSIFAIFFLQYIIIAFTMSFPMFLRRLPSPHSPAFAPGPSALTRPPH